MAHEFSSIPYAIARAARNIKPVKEPKNESHMEIEMVPDKKEGPSLPVDHPKKEVSTT